ncbi:hypothetical protein PN36_22150 [Candidatus Thiomargarita nelsonii]|uniref:histidine kinase n=1 Tax=Candidatus Thiomargarita nelsonii TaxID=1003181 RepID=A0A0A6RP27_9GAMM|nr:hypothetical protein PN36_22150 [Candidatus Thiomargarita nelsonii]
MPFWQKIRYSLSLRLLLLFIVTGIAIVIIHRVSLGFSIMQHFKHNVRPHIHQYLSYLHQEIGYPPNIEKARQLTERLPVDILIQGPDINWSSTRLDSRHFHFRPFRKHADGHLFRIGFYQYRFAHLTRKGPYDITFIMQKNLESAKGIWGIFVGIVAVLLVLSLNYFIIRWLLQPVSAMQEGVKRIGSGDLSHRIQTKRQDDLGELINSINQMTDELEKMLEAKRQLLLAISHELRTPMTRSKVSLALLEDSTYKQAIDQDLQEMEKLINELLETERLKGHVVLKRTSSSLNTVIKSVLSDYFSDKPIEAFLEPSLPTLQLDETRLRLLIRNLLENALKYSAKPVDIHTRKEKNAILLLVEDHGAGIAAEHIPHLSDPFYRVDPSRQRKTGGYGLGLYLCRLIAEAHGAQLEISSQLGRGTCVCLIFSDLISMN